MVLAWRVARVNKTRGALIAALEPRYLLNEFAPLPAPHKSRSAIRPDGFLVCAVPYQSVVLMSENGEISQSLQCYCAIYEPI